VSADPRDGFEAAWLAVFRRLTPREQLAAINAGRRFVDGQPIEDCMVEMLVELGDSPAQAREKVRTREPSDTDWRNALN
jgi:hypothetical protein